MALLACLLALIPLCASHAQQRPLSLVVNGAFERSGGWSKPANAQFLDSGRTGRCLEMRDAGGATQNIPALRRGPTFSCSVEMKTEGITPADGAGYAYAAVYQLDARGEWVAYKDFIQRTGTHDWQRHDFTFDLVPQAQTISLRCGIFNATGTAWFDNWTLVEGDRAYGIEEVATIGPGGGPPGGAVAVFREPGFPAQGAASSPERLAAILADAGLSVGFLSAADLADPRRLSPGLLNIVVLPYGASFPAEARETMIDFLRHGGSFISTGGYAFNNLLLHEEGRWIDEQLALDRRLAAALQTSALPDGGFETTQDAPLGGMALDGRWRRDGDICTITEEDPQEGRRCAKITVRAEQPREDRWYLDIAPQRGARYRVSGWIRTEDVAPIGNGFAYMALYEYGEDNELGKWKDFAHVTGTTGWQQFHYDFTPEASTVRLHIKLGLFRATGTAWFDDIRLANVAGTEPRPMNTATGKPADGLVLAPHQIGVFDAHFPLQRTVGAQAGEGQHIIPAAVTVPGPLTGWAAAGVQGYDNARWVELLAGRDRFGRERGAAGALMINYNGFYSGSMWGYFGVENRDLFDGAAPEMDAALGRLARFMVRGVFLRNLNTDLASYHDGEPVRRAVVVENFGAEARDCRVTFAVWPDGDAARAVGLESFEVSVPSGEASTVESPWQPGRFDADTYRLVATLAVDGQVIDEMRSGFVVQRDAVAQAGPELRYRDNYFTLNGRPMFLFGSDTWSNVYRSAFEDPWTWHLDHLAARDYGFNLYENLQFSNPDYVFKPEDWRQFEGMAQLTQKHGLVFMPCQLVGHNVAIGEDLLEKQAEQCRAYGERMRKYPGLLYYLNGDFHFRVDDKAALTELWNGWLAEKYGSLEALRESWGEEVYGEWRALEYPPPAWQRWDSVVACDKLRFDVWLTSRWVERHVAAVRSEDPDHPITSEYYQQPHGGIDLVLTLGSQDHSNIGYFDLPHRDIDMLPLRLRLNDLRLRGKGIGLGEYGVKTHPAWTEENGARGYHIVRTEEEQKQLFMAVAHYALGMGAAKVQNWCLRDASQWVFPWGVFYPNGRVPKDVAHWHRNLSLIWRHFTPRYEPPRFAVLLPDNMRLGAHGQVGIEIAYNAFRASLGAGVINEHHLGDLPAEVQMLIWPSPFCPDDETYEKVLQWVRGGGQLVVTGDISFNWDRKRTRTERLRELCGAQFVRELYRPPARPGEGATEARYQGINWRLNPCIEVRPAGAEVLLADADGTPLILRHRVGEGSVVFCPDPLEMGKAEDVMDMLRALRRLWWTGQAADARPAAPRAAPPPPPPGPDIHVMRQRLGADGWFEMAFNTNMPPGAADVNLYPAHRLRVAARYPGFIATTSPDTLVAVGCSGEAGFDGRPVVSGEAQVIYLSLDRQTLPQSRAVLLAPFSAGRTTLHSTREWNDPVMVIGDIADGNWRTFEVLDGPPDITLDEDTMTCLLLLCEREEASGWGETLSRAVQQPWEIEG